MPSTALRRCWRSIVTSAAAPVRSYWTAPGPGSLIPRPSRRRTGRAGLPAAAPLDVAQRLLCRFARLLAFLQTPLDRAHHEHEQREEDHQDEARGGDHFVVGRPVQAAAVVVGLCRRGQHEREQQHKRQDCDRQAAHRARNPTGARGRSAGCLPSEPMALLIASDLHKDMGGRPLLQGVSFKLERRERLTLAGRNGAGKTTLLRMLAGETSIDRGELTVAKGVRVALHDQRPPRERAIPLREYLLSGCVEELQIEAQLASLEAKMTAGLSDDALLARYARAQARLEARGGYLWRDRALAMARGLGFVTDDLDRSLDTFSGGELTRASLARAL